MLEPPTLTTINKLQRCSIYLQQSYDVVDSCIASSHVFIDYIETVPPYRERAIVQIDLRWSWE